MSIHILPFRCDLATFCAKTVIADLTGQLPDLSKTIILVPETTARIRAQFIALRKSLIDSAEQAGCKALIPPQIATPSQLFTERYPQANQATKNIHARLSLATALYHDKNLFANANKWQLADEIISAFNRISEHDYAAEPGTKSLEENTDKLASIWHDDTRMLLTLWQTWKNLYNEKSYPAFAYYKILNSDTYTAPHEHVYLCGMNHLSPCFAKWAHNLYKKGRLTWIVKANTSPIPVAYHPVQDTAAQLTTDTADTPVFPDSDSDYSRLLDQIFLYIDSPNGENTPFAERARQFAAKINTSPFSPRMRLFFPTTTEEHAWGIYIAVRRWLELKHQRIALVSLDRRLSRRIRAIFEKHKIPLIDYSGWELSTTSSAAALKHLLSDADEGLDIKTALALMRSPYCDLDIDRRAAIEAADYIENLLSHHQIQHSSIEKTLYGLEEVAADNPLSIILLKKIIAALSLIEQFKDKKEHCYTNYFECLFKAMKILGMYEKLSADSAGQRLISELQQLYNAVKQAGEQVYFNIWHNWILYRLEKSNFTPDLPDHGVFLMNPSQAELMQFDALAIIALDNRHFPHQPQTSLINENIRRELGLETYEQSAGLQFLLFRTLLESAEHLLLSCQQYMKDKKLMPSAWLTAIHHFHKIAYGDLTDYELQDTAHRCSSLKLRVERGCKAKIQNIAQPSPPSHLWPELLSVSAYQHLIDCPYRFYARYLLKIQSRPKVSDYWEAMSYGTYLHECLNQLHIRLNAAHKRLIWLAENRTEIINEAQQILHAQFKEAISNNYVNYFWLSDAGEAMTYYIDWMIEQQQNQTIASTQAEQRLEKELTDGLSMMGRADLIIQTKDGAILIDYKTGSLAHKKNIQNGEHIQLASYALLVENVNTIIYLALGAKNRGEQRILQGPELAECRDKNLQRLRKIRADYAAAQPLNAWGNKQAICQYCDYAGLCRRPAWDEHYDWSAISCSN